MKSKVRRRLGQEEAGTALQPLQQPRAKAPRSEGGGLLWGGSFSCAMSATGEAGAGGRWHAEVWLYSRTRSGDTQRADVDRSAYSQNISGCRWSLQGPRRKVWCNSGPVGLALLFGVQPLTLSALTNAVLQPRAAQVPAGSPRDPAATAPS